MDSNALFLSDDENSCTNYFIKHIYSNPKDLKTFVLKCCAKFSDKQIFIYSADINNLWQEFSSLFEVRKAAGGLVINKQDKSLFIKRNGKWDLPKGHAEKGESMEETALREVEEECGINNLSIKEPLLVTYHTYKLQSARILKEVHWFTMEYTGNYEGTPQTEEGITKVKWIKRKKHDKVLANTYPAIADVLNAFYELHDA